MYWSNDASSSMVFMGNTALVVDSDTSDDLQRDLDSPPT
jgi:hypothetical protein